MYGWGGNSNQEITIATAQTTVPTLIPELSRQGVKHLISGIYFVSTLSYVFVKEMMLDFCRVLLCAEAED